MTISRGTMGATIARLMVENAINSRKTNDLIRDASHRAEESAIEIQAAHLSAANSLAAAKGVVEVANSAVSVARAGASFGKAVDTEVQRADTRPQLDAGIQAEARTGDDTALRDVQLGRDGPTVGERFDDAQLEVLTDPDSVNRMYEGHLADGDTPAQAELATRQDLQDRGFSQPEAAQLVAAGRSRVAELRQGFVEAGHSPAEADRMTVDELTSMGFSQEEAEAAVASGKNGLSADGVADFMWSNRQTEEQKTSEYFREKWFDAFQQMAGTGAGLGLDGAGQDHREVGSRARDAQGTMEAIGDEAHAMSVEHQQKIDDLLTEGLTGEADTHKS